MRIAISTVMDSAKSGAWQVIKNIILELKNIDQTNQYLIFVEKTYTEDFGKLPDNFKIVRAPITAKQPILNILWHGFVLPFLIIKFKVDLLHLPWHSVAFFIKTKPTILTIHDITEYRLPNHYSKFRVLYRKIMLPVSSRLADKIIAVSEYTKNDVNKFLKVPKDKIDVVYNASNKRYVLLDKLKSKEYIFSKYGIDGDFILYVGQIQHPNKNLIPLLQAYNNMKSAGKLKHKLVLVGKKHHTGNIVYETVKELNLDKDVKFTGYVPDDDLPYFYNSADLFIYPSLFEGFGIPVIEAMSCGCPVITSNTSSLPEVAGDAGILINTNDVAEITKSMAILNNPTKKDEMIKKGFERIKMFSWKNSAIKLLNIYECFKK